PSLHQKYKDLRSHLINTGVLADDTDGLRFTQDYPFSAISPAAQVVSGTSVNGRTAWKLKDGSMTFAEWQDKQLADEEEPANQPLQLTGRPFPVSRGMKSLWPPRS